MPVWSMVMTLPRRLDKSQRRDHLINLLTVREIKNVLTFLHEWRCEEQTFLILQGCVKRFGTGYSFGKQAGLGILAGLKHEHAIMSLAGISPDPGKPIVTISSPVALFSFPRILEETTNFPSWTDTYHYFQQSSFLPSTSSPTSEALSSHVSLRWPVAV